MEPSLSDPIQYVKGVGPRRAKLFESRLGVSTVEDLLYYLPFRHEKTGDLKTIADVRVGDKVTFHAKVERVRSRRTRHRKNMLEALLADDTGAIAAVWFGQPYMAKKIKEGDSGYFRGTVKFYNKMQVVAPEFEPDDGEPDDFENGGLIPVYQITEGLTQKVVRRVIRSAVEKYIALVEDHFSEDYRRRRDLLRLPAALFACHFPEEGDDFEEGLNRLKYDELFFFELGMALRRGKIKELTKEKPVEISGTVDARIRRRFDFDFTGAQDRVVAEIMRDMSSDRPMNRLLQGDVGSGKTAVAVYSILTAVANRRQAAFMAPTEILAEQHFINFSNLLRGSRVSIALLTGSKKSAERREVLKKLATGRIDVVVGTHALFSKDVVYRDLALVVVDEQHKFGVMQRSNLRKKGSTADCLVMTATPIPRTLALTVFGDLDVSIIDEMPPGRKPVATRVVSVENRNSVYEAVRDEVSAGRQAFVVCPLIEESAALDLADATRLADTLANKVYPEFRIGLVHGSLPQDERELIMKRFRDGKYDVLVATTVIEVGVDIPNASVMVIEEAQRFGLAQLHQLRGRVGRGRHGSYCYLIARAATESSVKRLNIMAETEDGFRIAETDLELRGPGEFFGIRQTGLPEFKLANIVTDFRLLQLARRDAFEIVDADPAISDPGNGPLKRKVQRFFGGRLDLVDVG